MRQPIVARLQNILSLEARRKISRWAHWPPVGWVKMVGLRRLRPIDPEWGFLRGGAVDRYYIERFLEEHADDVQGVVMEVGTDEYLRRYGGKKVLRHDVLHVEEDRPPITIIGSLTDGAGLESSTYDCVILTQTLNVIYDVEAAIRTVHRILKPGGVVLATLPGISKVSRYDMQRWGYFWSFTTASARRTFECAFPPDRIQVGSFGNVSAAVAFLHGLSWRELSRRTLDHDDPDFQLIITVRAEKPGTG